MPKRIFCFRHSGADTHPQASAQHIDIEWQASMHRAWRYWHFQSVPSSLSFHTSSSVSNISISHFQSTISALILHSWLKIKVSRFESTIFLGFRRTNAPNNAILLKLCFAFLRMLLCVIVWTSWRNPIFFGSLWAFFVNFILSSMAINDEQSIRNWMDIPYKTNEAQRA